MTPQSGPPRTTVLPAAAPPGTRGPAWLSPLRGAAAAGLGLALGYGGPLALGVLAFVLLPACSYGAAPPALLAATLVVLLLAAVAPVAAAGARLWWVGVPAAALAVHGVLPLAGSLLTERQSGFCF